MAGSTDQKKASLKRAAGEQVFTLKVADRVCRVIVEEMSEAAVILSLHGTILYANGRFSELVKTPLDHTSGASFAAFVADPYQNRLVASIAAEEKSREEIKIRTTAGTLVPVAISCSRTVVDDIPAICVITTDLTERKRQETTMAEERRQATEKIRANDRLGTVALAAAALAHEIANPLQWMLSTVQLMQEDLAGGDTNAMASWKHQLEEFRGEIGRLASMLQDFRTLARPENLTLAPVPLHALISGLRKIIVPQLATAGLAVDYQIPDGLPLIHGDADKIKQVLLNLCKNAIEASSTGGTLTIKACAEAENLIIEIADTGTGIPEGLDIFKPFATTKDKGSGLGLTIVRQIVAEHGGSITYQSEKGKGTTFRITLPTVNNRYFA